MRVVVKNVLDLSISSRYDVDVVCPLSVTMSNEAVFAKKSYRVGRKEASERLGVSTRTLDRYIKSGKLSTRYISGRIWLSSEELSAFSGSVRHGAQDSVSIMSRVDVSRDGDSQGVDDVVSPLSSAVQDGQFKEAISSTPKTIGSKEVYKKLFNDLRDEIREKQERLEIANYRVGQLEAQLRNSIPMLEYHRENYKKKKIEEKLREDINQSDQVIKLLRYRIKQQKALKTIFLVILVAVLALQPLWLLSYFS